MLGVAISGLNQPEPGLRNVGGRERQGAAQGIEGLLHTLADGGLYLGLGALPADFTQTGSEDRRRRNRSRSKGEHDHRDGEKNEDGKRERHELDLNPDYFANDKVAHRLQSDAADDQSVPDGVGEKRTNEARVE